MSVENFDQQIFSTCITARWLEEILLADKNAIFKSKGIYLKDLKAESIGLGAGFLSHVLRIQLIWSENSSGVDDGILPKMVVVKAPTTDKIEAKFSDFDVPEECRGVMLEKMVNNILRRYHRGECTFYEMVRENKDCQVSIPKIFYVKDTGNIKSGVIVMEDLSRVGALVNFYHGMTTGQVYGVVDQIVNLHVFSLTHDYWKERCSVFPKEQFIEWGDFLERATNRFSEMGLEKLKNSTGNLKHMFQPDFVHATVRSHEELNLPAVVVHGDTWTHNILFSKIGQQVTDQVLAIIDWQMVHVGSIAEDIAVLLVSSVKADVRRREKDNVLKYYYEKLTEKMGGQRVQYTLEDVHRAYDRIYSYAVGLYVLFWFSLMTMDVAEGPEKMEKISEVANRAQALVDDLEKLEEKK